MHSRKAPVVVWGCRELLYDQEVEKLLVTIVGEWRSLSASWFPFSYGPREFFNLIKQQLRCKILIYLSISLNFSVLFQYTARPLLLRFSWNPRKLYIQFEKKLWETSVLFWTFPSKIRQEAYFYYIWALSLHLNLHHELLCKSKEKVFWNEPNFAKFKYQNFSQYLCVILNCTNAAPMCI